MAIDFPAQAIEDRMRLVVSFPAVVDGRQIECSISFEALKDRFGMSDFYDSIPHFTTHRRHIERIAANLIVHGRFENDGTILIRAADV